MEITALSPFSITPGNDEVDNPAYVEDEQQDKNRPFPLKIPVDRVKDNETGDWHRRGVNENRVDTGSQFRSRDNGPTVDSGQAGSGQKASS